MPPQERSAGDPMREYDSAGRKAVMSCRTPCEIVHAPAMYFVSETTYMQVEMLQGALTAQLGPLSFSSEQFQQLA